MAQSKTPFDEIAIFLASVCLKIHTRIFASNTVWSTKVDNDLTGVFQFTLAYRGELVFFDTTD